MFLILNKKCSIFFTGKALLQRQTEKKQKLKRKLKLQLRLNKVMDDNYSASELRRRYNKGGSLQDSDLSAAQLRARHNVKGRGQIN